MSKLTVVHAYGSLLSYLPVLAFPLFTSNYMVLELRSKQQADLIENLVTRLDELDTARDASDTAGKLAGELKGAVDRVTLLEQQVQTLQNEANRADQRFLEHCERSASSIGSLELRISMAETAAAAVPGEHVLVAPDELSEPQPLNQVIARLEDLVQQCRGQLETQSTVLQTHADDLLAKVRHNCLVVHGAPLLPMTASEM